jgi:Methylamine utilisation protein MauE
LATTHRCLLYGLLLAAMAAGQLASLEAFGAALVSYELIGSFVPAAKVGLPALELVVAVALLLSRRLPPLASKAAGVAGVLVALVWTTLAAQAFARGLMVANCGCFGAHLAQSLRWWVLLEDAYMVALAFLAARSLGARLQPGPSRSSSRSRSITRPGSSASAGGCSRRSPRSESSVPSSDR